MSKQKKKFYPKIPLDAIPNSKYPPLHNYNINNPQVQKVQPAKNDSKELEDHKQQFQLYPPEQNEKLRVKRKRNEDPLIQFVVEGAVKKPKLSLLEAFSLLSTQENKNSTNNNNNNNNRKRKLFRLEETIDYEPGSDFQIEGNNMFNKKIKLEDEVIVQAEEEHSNQFVIDIYKVDVSVKEEELNKVPVEEVVFIESPEYSIDCEYDSDRDSEDENDENYYGNDYPEDDSSSVSERSSDGEDTAYFSDYQDYDDDVY